MNKLILTILILIFPLVTLASPQFYISHGFNASREECGNIKAESTAHLSHFISANQLRASDFMIDVAFAPGRPVYNPVDPIGRGPGDQRVNPSQSSSVCDVTLRSRNQSWGFETSTSEKFAGFNRMQSCRDYLSNLEEDAIVVDIYNAGGISGYCEVRVIRMVPTH